MIEEIQMRLFYAQHREDEWIAANLPLPEKGFYVDIGCAHPFTTSNTAFLRDRKWEGLAVDGNPVWAEDWADIPSFCCSIISSKSEVSFFKDPEVPYRSRIGASGGHDRVAETIEECLDRHRVGKIDFFSLDVEGQELDVLQMLDFDLHQPAIMMIEYDTADIGKDWRIPIFMMEVQNYKLRHKNESNMIFTRE